MSYMLLCGYCKSNKKDLVRDLLKETEESGHIINVFTCNGSLFQHLLDRDSHELMKMILDYYERNVITKEGDSSSESSKATTKLSDKIFELTEDRELSDGMRSALGRYLDGELCHEKISDDEVLFDYDPALANRDIPLSEIYSSDAGTLATAQFQEEAKLAGETYSDHSDSND